jgi:Domain of Unknown Function (DUF930)
VAGLKIIAGDSAMAIPQAEVPGGAAVGASGVARSWAPGFSLALHALLILAIGLLASTRTAERPPPPIVVEVIGAAQFEAALAAPDAGDERVPAAPQAPMPSAEPDRMTTATQLYAARILDDPANAQVRRTLAAVERGERIIQLCNLEGLEQLRQAQPDAAADEIVPYAFADPTIRGYTMDAPAGAFRRDAEWYAIAIVCSVGPDYESVTDFRFRIGEPIPESEWAAHNLLAADDNE